MKLFVSYASADAKWAEWVVWELENGKPRHACVAQFRDFPPGTSFIDQMRAAAESECTVSLFSQSYFRSRYCRQELNAALVDPPHRLLPIRLEECDPGAYLRDRIYIDLVGRAIDEARERLLRGVEAYVMQTVRNTATRGFRRRPNFPGPQITTVRCLPVKRASGPSKVLFIAPDVGLDPRKQFQAMKASAGGAIEFKGVFQVQVHTLFQELNREAPDVLHFSGKQSGGNILMRTEAGTLTTISDLALAGMFDSLNHSLKLVVIDTCHSLRCAQTAAKVIPFAMGVEGDPYEDDCVLFYRVFYQALAAGTSLEGAFHQARSAARLAKVPLRNTPQLLCRSGANPAKAFLTKKV